MVSVAQYCRAHRDRVTTLSCGECGRPFCRDCLVTRNLTARTIEFRCRACAGVASARVHVGPATIIRDRSVRSHRGRGLPRVRLAVLTVVLAVALPGVSRDCFADATRGGFLSGATRGALGCSVTALVQTWQQAAGWAMGRWTRVVPVRSQGNSN